MCMYAYMYYMHTCIHDMRTSAHASIHACTYACTFMHACMHQTAQSYTHICLYTLYACMH